MTTRRIRAVVVNARIARIYHLDDSPAEISERLSSIDRSIASGAGDIEHLKSLAKVPRICRAYREIFFSSAVARERYLSGLETKSYTYARACTRTRPGTRPAGRSDYGPGRSIAEFRGRGRESTALSASRFRAPSATFERVDLSGGPRDRQHEGTGHHLAIFPKETLSSARVSFSRETRELENEKRKGRRRRRGSGLPEKRPREIRAGKTVGIQSAYFRREEQMAARRGEEEGKRNAGNAEPAGSAIRIFGIHCDSIK